MFLRKLIEEPFQNFLFIADGAPDNGISVVVNNDCHILVPLLVACLVNSDIDKVIKAYRRLFLKLFIDSAEYFAYGVPFNSHELSYAFLGAVHGEPGYSVLK